MDTDNLIKAALFGIISTIIGIIIYFLAKFKYSNFFGRLSESTGARPITITGIINQILAMCGLGTNWNTEDTAIDIWKKDEKLSDSLIFTTFSK